MAPTNCVCVGGGLSDPTKSQFESVSPEAEIQGGGLIR